MYTFVHLVLLGLAVANPEPTTRKQSICEQFGSRLYDHICVDNPENYGKLFWCECREGYDRIDDRCVSTNTPLVHQEPTGACKFSGHSHSKLCQYECINTEGSYKCTCPPGYELHPSGIYDEGEFIINYLAIFYFRLHWLRH